MAREKIKIRPAEHRDLEGILDVEFERYAELHTELGNSREDLRARFEQRLGNIPDYYLVAVDSNDRVLGSLSALPTNKSPAGFVSWEESTQNGTCSSFDSSNDYENLYLVNLDVLKNYTKKDVQYMLMSKIAVIAVRSGFKVLYFESRMPGFRKWTDENLPDWRDASSEEQDSVARSYANLKGEDGLPYDRLLRFYVKNGFGIGTVVRGAFEDPESNNYGVVFDLKNPALFKSRIARIIAAKTLSLVSRSPRLLTKLI